MGTKTKAKLEALKNGRELPVDVQEMWRSTDVGQVPDTDERAVIGLAREIHDAESDDVSVSWSAQVRAADYFNAHGLFATLDEMFRLRDLRGQKALK